MMEISDEEREEDSGNRLSVLDSAAENLVNPGVLKRDFERFVKGTKTVRLGEREAASVVRRGDRGGVKRQKVRDVNPEDVKDDDRERSNNVSINLNPENLSAVMSGHATPADDARDSGVLSSQVPPTTTRDMERFNRQTTVERKIYRVCGPELIESTAPVDEMENTQSRFSDDHEGKVSLTLRLPPEQTLTRKGRNHIKLWMILTELKIRPNNVVMLNYFSAEAEFQSGSSANFALEKIEKLKIKKLTAKIKKHQIFCKGVITDWPSTIPELWAAISDKTNIVSLERMYRRKWDASNKTASFLETDNIIITFRDNKLRGLKIFNNMVGLRVRPYIMQVRQCYNCFRYGHTKNACKSETKCIICGDKAHGQCTKPVKCCNCDGSHRSTFRGCSIFAKNKKINVVKAHNNISFYRARKIVEGKEAPVQTSHDIQVNPGAWPTLPDPKGGMTYSAKTKSNSRNEVETPKSKNDYRVEYPREDTHKDKRRKDPSRSFYKQFNLREEEITKSRRGVALKARHSDASEEGSCKDATSCDGREDTTISAEISNARDTVEGILLLLQRDPQVKSLLIEALKRIEGFKGRKQELSKRVMDYDMVVLTETKRSSRSQVYFPGFRTLNSDNPLGSGGVSISIRSHIDFDVVPIVALPFGHPRRGIAGQDFRAVFDSVGNGVDDVIILGDFNAHNTLWNCDLTNENGDTLLDIMNEKDLLCVNVDTKSRLGYSGQRDSNLDLLFCSMGMIDEMECCQEDDNWGSDHFPLTFRIDRHTRIYRKLTNRVSTKRTDWERYCGFVAGEFETFSVTDMDNVDLNFDSYYKTFIDILKNGIARASGRKLTPEVIKKPNKNKRSHRWWDVQCDEMIRNRKSALSTFKKHKTIHSWVETKDVVRWLKRLLMRRREKISKNFAKELIDLQILGMFGRLFEYLRRPGIIFLGIIGNRKTEKRKLGGQRTVCPSPTAAYKPYDNFTRATGEFDAPFSRAELDRAITIWPEETLRRGWMA
ncbi:uncharacterized protein LOC143899358 isoform X2 [Temnothorax americanus]|uniref:uncharacterized protein LOC143899358 isoform X2 n=1 Tax=Temnothorax americanus TaxID=1964332 RepID=UPI004067C476